VVVLTAAHRVACDDVVVQGITRSDRELLDAQALVGELVPEGSVFAFLAEHRQELFPNSFIADLFSSSTGRPSLSADLIGSVLVLKELCDLSDPQTADAVRYDIGWKEAYGRSLTQTSFDPSTLVYWRKRDLPTIIRTGCSTRSRGSSPRPGSCVGVASGVWIRRCLTTRWPPRTR
jgi:hypothetical protein